MAHAAMICQQGGQNPRQLAAAIDAGRAPGFFANATCGVGGAIRRRAILRDIRTGSDFRQSLQNVPASLASEQLSR
jgi:hypothetical protein